MEKKAQGTKSFRMRISILFMASLIGLSLFVVLFSVGILWVSVANNGKTLALRQEETIANALEQEIAALNQLGQLTIRNSILLEHLSHLPHEVDNYAVLNNALFKVLLDTRNLNASIRQVVLLKYPDQTLYQVGGPWVSPARAKSMYECIQADSQLATARGTSKIQMSMGASFFQQDPNALTLYFTVYDTVNVYQKIGLLCISVEENTLKTLLQNSLFEDMYLVDATETLLSSTTARPVGEIYGLDFTEAGKSGVTTQGGGYQIWTRLPSTGWTLVVSTSLFELVGNTIWPLMLMLGLVLILCLAVSTVCYAIMKNTLRPLAALQDYMGIVARGNMQIRMDVEQYDEEEFRDMAGSFNKMVRDVEGLMERVRLEQGQMKQIELSALQSQIKPHFLYNTLECIHWQALTEGDKKVSKLIKALASYYRLCLGKGQDLVTLDRELAHIESYLVIQNARYSDIIDYLAEVDDSLLQTPIPRMTLQPLVENAIYHGIRIKEGGRGCVTISDMRTLSP